MSTISQVITKAPAVPAPSFAPVQNGLFSEQQNFGPTQELNDGYRKPLVSQPPLIQFKLVIGQPGDKYEQEADRIADQVMRMPEPAFQRKPT